jgi:hypothetical protein
VDVWTILTIGTPYRILRAQLLVQRERWNRVLWIIFRVSKWTGAELLFCWWESPEKVCYTNRDLLFLVFTVRNP